MEAKADMVRRLQYDGIGGLASQQVTSGNRDGLEVNPEEKPQLEDEGEEEEEEFIDEGDQAFVPWRAPAGQVASEEEEEEGVYSEDEVIPRPGEYTVENPADSRTWTTSGDESARELQHLLTFCFGPQPVGRPSRLFNNADTGCYRGLTTG